MAQRWPRKRNSALRFEAEKLVTRHDPGKERGNPRHHVHGHERESCDGVSPGACDWRTLRIECGLLGLAACTTFACRDPGSNRGPSDLQFDALPTELSRLVLQKVIVSLVRIQPSEADFRTCGLAELLKKQEPFLSLATSPQVLPHFHKWREAHSRAPRRQFRRGGVGTCGLVK